MKYKFSNETFVGFEFGTIIGYGTVIGVATTPQPILGCMYIIEVISSDMNLPTTEYPFKTITVPENALIQLCLGDQPCFKNSTEMHAYIRGMCDGDVAREILVNGNSTKHVIKSSYIKALRMMPQPELDFIIKQKAYDLCEYDVFRDSQLTVEILYHFLKSLVRR